MVICEWQVTKGNEEKVYKPIHNYKKKISQAFLCGSADTWLV